MMTEFRGRLRAGQVVLGEVSGDYAEYEDGSLSGTVYAPEEVPLVGVLQLSDLVLDLGDDGAMRVEIVGQPLRAGRGVAATFIRLDPPGE